MRRNVIAAVSYNVVAATLAALGLVSALLGAVLMPISSLTVLGLSLRAWTFDAGEPR